MQSLFLRSRAAVKELGTNYERALQGAVDWEAPLNFILGQRGVGKTTLLLQRLKKLNLPPEQALYIDLGDLYFQANRLIDFAEEYIQGGGRYLLIDEVHRYGYDTWASELKQLYDLYRSRLKVTVTGSSVVRILNKQADLSRRAVSYRLPGLSFREYLLLQQQIDLPRLTLDDTLSRHRVIAAEIVDKIQTPLPLLAEYWRQGYYPFFLEGQTSYADRLANIIQTVLEQDIPHATENTGVNTRKLARLLYAVASSVPFIPNINKLAERSGISRITLLRYLQVLEDAHIINGLRKESRGIAALGKPDKLYLDNPNLLHALAPQQVTTGALRETFFLNQLTQLTYSEGFIPPEIRLAKQGDFTFVTPERRILFEIGGASKGFQQIGEAEDHFVVADVTLTEHPQRIPLWLFGFLY